MSKRVVDSQAVRSMANDVQRVSEDIRAALARCARNVDQAPWLPWERGHGWGKFDWNGVYSAIDHETAGWFNIGGLQGDVSWLRAHADMVDWEANVMAVIDGMIAVPAWLLSAITSRSNGDAGGSEGERPNAVSRQPQPGKIKKDVTPVKATPQQINVGKAMAYLGVKAVTAYAGKSDENDGQCVSLVKRYIHDVDPSITSVQITPVHPGNGYNANWEKISRGDPAFTVKAGDVLYFDYGHVAIATSDMDPSTRKFSMIESHGYVRGPVPVGITAEKLLPGGYLPEGTDSVVQTTTQSIDKVTAIMRPKV